VYLSKVLNKVQKKFHLSPGDIKNTLRVHLVKALLESNKSEGAQFVSKMLEALRKG
jgi:hypothetical protein